MKRLIWLLLIGTACAQYAPSGAHFPVSGGGSGGTITLQQKQSFTGVPLSGAFAGAQIVGNFNICAVEYLGAGPVSGITDSKGNTYAKAYGPFTTGDGQTFDNEYWISTAIAASTAGTNTVSIAFTGTPSAAQTFCYEVHTASGVVTFDKGANHVTPSAASGSTGTTATSANANSFVIAWTSPSAGPATTPGAPWTNDGDPSGSFGSDYIHQIVSSTGTFSATFTDGTCEWNASVAIFGSH